MKIKLQPDCPFFILKSNEEVKQVELFIDAGGQANVLFGFRPLVEGKSLTDVTLTPVGLTFYPKKYKIELVGDGVPANPNVTLPYQLVNKSNCLSESVNIREYNALARYSNYIFF
jgi:hypothetical protein